MSDNQTGYVELQDGDVDNNNQPATKEDAEDIKNMTMAELLYHRPGTMKKIGLKRKHENEENGDEIVLDKEDSKESSTVKKEEHTDSKDASSGADQDEDKARENLAPQIMINENGEIVINEQSLIVQKKVDNSELTKNKILVEDEHTFHAYRKRKEAKKWTREETLRFYKALSQIGTDFGLMQSIFPNFTRNDIKLKFKREEKVNSDLVDLALKSRLPMNIDIFNQEEEKGTSSAPTEDNDQSNLDEDIAELEKGAAI